VPFVGVLWFLDQQLGGVLLGLPAVFEQLRDFEQPLEVLADVF